MSSVQLDDLHCDCDDKERMGELLEPLMSDERDEILDLYGNEKLEE